MLGFGLGVLVQAGRELAVELGELDAAGQGAERAGEEQGEIERAGRRKERRRGEQDVAVLPTSAAAQASGRTFARTSTELFA